MAKDKDPAFLFYSKDWLEGTAELMPEEKGVYIDLLCYQHQRGQLPSDVARLSRLVGLSVQEFEKIWKTLASKFKITAEKTINLKLEKVMIERSAKGSRNRIIGTFASVLKGNELTKKQYIEVKKSFNVDDFTEVPTERLTERLTEWYHERLKSIAIGNGNEDAIENEDGSKNEKVIILPFDSETFNSAWAAWKEYKSKEKKFTYKSPISEQIALKRLGEISENNEQKALEIIETSIANGWDGLFELKINHNAKHGTTKADTNATIASAQKFFRESGIGRTGN